MQGPSRRRSLLLRGVRVLGLGLCGLVGLFLVALGAALLYVDSAPGRRLAVTKVNQILGPSFRGRIEIESLKSLGIFGISGASVTIFDASGRPVITARGVRARIAPWTLARTALFGKREPITISLTDVSIDDADVRLDTDASGQLDLVNAFAPRTPASGTPANSQAQGVLIDIEGIALEHVWAHGVIAGTPTLDADIRDLRGAFSYGPDRLQGDVSKASIVARHIANGADVAGSLEAHVEDPNASLSALAGHVAWRGTAGTLAHSLEASLEKSKLDAVLEAPSFDPQAVRSLWPGSTIESSGSLRVHARGALPTIAVDFAASLGQATFGGQGQVALADGEKATLSIVAHDVDIHQFAGAAPKSRLGLTGNLSGSESAAGAIDLAATLRFLGGTVGGQELPAANISATGARSSANELRAHLDARVEEPAAPTHVMIDLTPEGKSFALYAALESSAQDLNGVPELKHAVSGSLKIAAKGTLDLESLSLDARVQADAAHLARGATSLTSASASVHTWGPLAKLSLAATVQGRGLVAGGRHATSVDIVVSGAESAPHVTVSARGTDIPTTEASADIGLGHGVTLRSLHLDLARAAEHATVTADSVRVGGEGVRVERARIEGLGWPATLSLEQSGEAIHVRAASQGIDLGRAGRLGHIEEVLSGGTLSFDTDVRFLPGRALGKATVALEDATIAGVRDLSSRVEVAVDARRIHGKASAQARDIGSIDIEAPSLDLGGADPLSPASWRQAWGAVSFDVSCDLAKVLDLTPPDQRPFGEARGHLSLKGSVGRTSPADATPDLKLSFKTDGLALAPNTPRTRDIDGVMVVGPPAWHLRDVDFDGALAINGGTGFIDLETQIRDRKGELLQVHLTLPHFPYRDLFYDTARLEEDARTSPFDIRVAVPERGLGGLPDILKQGAVTGMLKAEAHASGTLLMPHVDLEATLHDPHFSGETQSLSMDVDVSAHYDGKQGSASIKAGSGDSPLVDASATFDAEFAQLLDPGESLSWSASGRAHFAGFPLSAIPALDAKLVSGKLSGDATLAGLHKNARANVDVVVDGLRVGNVDYKSARVYVKTDGPAMEAGAHIDQTDGVVDAKVRAAGTWGAAIVPALDPKQPLVVELTSKNFRIAALLPLLSQSLDELDGRLDASMRASLEPGTGGATFAGTMSLSRGLIEASAGGGELHDVSATARFKPDGSVVVDHLSASGLTGRLQGSASAQFAGTRFQSAKASLVIPTRSAIPLTANGIEIGNIDGQIDVSVTASDDGRALTLGVQVPHLRVALPEGTSSDVQPLGVMDNVHIGAHKGSRTTLLLVPLDPSKPPAPDSPSSRTAIAVNIADVEVRRGTDLKVDLDGTLHVESGAKTRVTGQIHLMKGGLLNVQGKNFEVESGTVTFSGGDPGNPEVVVKADWAAPDGTVVSANFVGPLKTGKVTLSAEPTLPKQEIVELLLYGTTSGQQAQTPSSSTENTAIATAGGQAAQPFNHALNQLGLGAVTAKVDTSASSTPKPEVEVQIARGISIQVAYVLGMPPPGVNPDTALLSVDWRFLTKWSLESTVGNLGTTIFDLLWQSRY